MGRGRKSWKLFGPATLVIAALVFGGCDWPMFGYDPGLTHFSPDKAINSANVSTIQQLFISPGEFGPPAVSNGVVYAGAQSGNLYAFDANGVSNCSGAPNQCSPLWTGSTGGIGPTASPAVANGVVYVVSSSGTLYAFDASGVTN